MKRILKSRIFIFILGMVIASTITAYATLSLTAEDVTYGAGTVKSALDTLYTKVKPAYTGLTSVTPTTSEQTLNTANTILNSNITVGAIPSTYKNLTTATTVAANKLLTGTTAYDNLGNLITGSVNTDCVSGYTTSLCNTTACNIPTGFRPSAILIMQNDSNYRGITYYNTNYSTSNMLWVYLNGNKSGSIPNDFELYDGGFYLKWSNAVTNLYYMACK